MKTKFLFSVIITCLTLQSSAFAQTGKEVITTELKAQAKEQAKKDVKAEAGKKGKTVAPAEAYNSTKDIADLKTFDFERIFAQADKFFDAAQNWRVLKCFPKTGFLCSKRECPQMKMVEASAIVMNKDQKTLALCRNKICEYYPAEFVQTGVFINVKVKDT